MHPELRTQLSVFSPRIASITTRALNFGPYCFLVTVMDPPRPITPPALILFRGLKIGVHYSLQRAFPQPHPLKTLPNKLLVSTSANAAFLSVLDFDGAVVFIDTT